MSGTPRGDSVLYVDDEEENRSLFQLQFGDTYDVFTAANAQQALEILARTSIGVLLTDERMPGMSGIELLSRAVREFPDVVRVIVSAYADANRLLAAMNQGHAHEYIIKPWALEELGSCIARGLELAERRRQLIVQAELAGVLVRDSEPANGSWELVGASRGLDRAVGMARRAAHSDATVLIRGETGTGKELFARLIHQASRRADGPFIRVNCAALAEGVVESELFGHEKGAFTGASAIRKGRFELAHGGSIFLDEIGDVSPKVQVGLLRVLQEREMERVGGSKTIKLDVRVIAATHQDLEDKAREGTFREDLYYRLNVLPIHIPPLRDRADDIPALIEHFIRKHDQRATPRRVVSQALHALTRYDWPGNVRELENLVHRALVMSDADEIELEDFCLSLVPPVATEDVRTEARSQEAEELRNLLLKHGGNCSRAARALGIPRTTLVSRARRHGLL
jgi:DNA-binding NtrC family response regulator